MGCRAALAPLAAPNRTLPPLRGTPYPWPKRRVARAFGVAAGRAAAGAGVQAGTRLYAPPRCSPPCARCLAAQQPAQLRTRCAPRCVALVASRARPAPQGGLHPTLRPARACRGCGGRCRGCYGYCRFYRHTRPPCVQPHHPPHHRLPRYSHASSPGCSGILAHHNGVPTGRRSQLRGCASQGAQQALQPCAAARPDRLAPAREAGCSAQLCAGCGSPRPAALSARLRTCGWACGGARSTGCAAVLHT